MIESWEEELQNMEADQRIPVVSDAWNREYAERRRKVLGARPNQTRCPEKQVLV